MNVLFELLFGVLRAVVKLALLLFTLLFLLAVLCVGLMLVLVVLVRYLLTGRKPAIFATVSRFNQAAQQFRPRAWPGHGHAGASRNGTDAEDVVDVQAHEVRTSLAPPQPPQPKSTEL